MSLAESPVACDHNGHIYYYPADNEQGWKCSRCGWKPGEPEGYSPQHDRALIEIKVWGILNDLFDSSLIYVSNGTAAAGLVSSIADRCREIGQYDQTTICRLIFEADAGHEKYWKELSDSIIAGNDTRDRCACGKLATWFNSGRQWCSGACRDKELAS
jgi:hypothetical protein